MPRRAAGESLRIIQPGREQGNQGQRAGQAPCKAQYQPVPLRPVQADLNLSSHANRGGNGVQTVVETMAQIPFERGELPVVPTAILAKEQVRFHGLALTRLQALPAQVQVLPGFFVGDRVHEILPSID